MLGVEGGSTNCETLKHKLHKLSTTFLYYARPPHFGAGGGVEMDPVQPLYNSTQFTIISPPLPPRVYVEELLRNSQKMNEMRVGLGDFQIMFCAKNNAAGHVLLARHTF